MILAYPIGLFVAPERVDASERTAWIERLARLPAALRTAVVGLTDERLDTPYRPGGWTVRQVVHHVADSHVNAYIRMRLALTEDEPVIKPYDENAWAALPDAVSLPVAPSLALLDALHHRWVVLLRALPDDAWHRAFLHPVNGRTTLHAALATYAWHGDHHTAHITRLREREGW